MSKDKQNVFKAESTSRSQITREVGVAGAYDPNQALKQDEFIAALRGPNAIKKYREMRENDPIIGALLTAISMILRAVEWRVEAVDDSPEAEEAREFVEGVLFEDMDHTWEEFMSEVTEMLAYGFSVFETVFKRRDGYKKDPDKTSFFNDGRLGIHKLAPRAQWSLTKFDLEPNGRILGAHQMSTVIGYQNVYIPADKMLLFRTTSANNDPSGRSVLRNAYKSYHYVTRIQEYEAIAIERELNGIPVGRIPSEYLNATDGAQYTFKEAFKTMLRDVKRNEQGYILLPSDVHEDVDGKPTDKYLVGFELVASSGTRDIDTTKVVVRHQQDMARTVLADFLMLGQSDRGSFALSKNKTDLFLQAVRGYLSGISAVVNRQLLTRLWEYNALPRDLMPLLTPGDVAPVDLEELGTFLRNMSVAGAPLFPDDDLENDIRSTAGLPERAVSDDADGLLAQNTIVEEDEEPEEDAEGEDDEE